MTHRSRLAGFIIDSQQGSLPEAADFWGQALGLNVRDYDEKVSRPKSCGSKSWARNAWNGSATAGG